MSNKNILIDSSLSLNDSKMNDINENENIQNHYIMKNSISGSKKYKTSKLSNKIVKFKEKPIIIEVECWKQYNLEQTADENFENYIDEIMEKDNKENKDIKDNKENNNNGNNKKRSKGKSENITCTCHII